MEAGGLFQRKLPSLGRETADILWMLAWYGKAIAVVISMSYMIIIEQ